jgi:hypothetical protein
MDPNALTLDYCDFWFDGVLQAQHEHVSVIQRRALDLERPVQVRLRFEVQLAPDFEPVGEVFLVVETPERFTIQVNGAPVASRDCGAYRDTSFRLVDIRGRLRPGSNEVVLTTDFHQPREVYENLRRAKVFESEKNKLTYDSEIEAVYLIGRFGVATPGTFTPLPREACRYHGPFVIGPAPDRVFAGDLTAQGLPFYAGTVRLVRDLALSPGQCGCSRFGIATKMACFASLRVNGQRLRSWYWRPYEADLAGALVPGTNRFEIELVSGLRNLLGPHHLLEGESYGVGPGAFFKEPNIWGSSPWSDDYCFTEFGVRL